MSGTEEQDGVLDHFYRAGHPVVQESDGVGLGLALAKIFVGIYDARMGGIANWSGEHFQFQPADAGCG